MPDYTSDDFCPIEQKIRDSSVLLALQRMLGDAQGDYHYTFDDIPNDNDAYYQMRFMVKNPEGGRLVSAGIVATDTLMSHHFFITIFPCFGTQFFQTEDSFDDDSPV